MELNLNYEGFEENLFKKSNTLRGIQYIFIFDNDFGASVVKHLGSYGHEDDLWERKTLFLERRKLWEI